MKITKKAIYEVSFTIEAFWDEEGGMGTDCFGPTVYTLEEAIHTLELAMASSKDDWVIVGKVKRTLES